jgi:penicillin-binding protein 1A
MEGALAKSINTIAVDVLIQTGISNVVDLAQRMGVKSKLPEYPSLALGTASVSLEEMVCVYAEIVNGGKKVKPYYLMSIESNKGVMLEKFENIQSNEQLASPENCRIITKMLESVVNEGTGSAIRNEWGIDSDFAGKTGTTQDQADGWFIGVTPKLVAGAWVGAEDPSIHFRTLGTGAGGHTALPIVGHFFSQVLHNGKYQALRYSKFESPSEESLAMMAILPYREMLETKGGFFRSLFGSRNKQEREELKLKESASNQEASNQESRPDDQTAKKPFWKKMKEVFKKKKQ